eukprot:CAMPEP_0194176312 /NCGR_PEP_ID=MMETSP0154-20130528/10236_1 /TAXON_ID=1049557 /ORGANISM="Thalassiothrix antarctica, Strain L6-D1" /LENGTH=401 /DNA_ID=CAMNT_0038890433 /DNA_START=21 /DNA_END=1223 /DNA_ORIENTATION=-
MMKVTFHQKNRSLSSSSSSSMISDMIQSFRWKAAKALTSNLSEVERSKLLNRLDAIDCKEATMKSVEENKRIVEETKVTTQVTIGEAVAAARIEEARTQESRWDKEKEKLIHDAEEAARLRIESEILLLKNKQKDKEESLLQQEESQQEEQKEHPMLGKVVADFGYKKIYQVPAQTLVSIPVWKKQRCYRHDRAKVIVKDKLKTPYLGLPGIIVLHEDEDGKMSILDGQHRVGALALLLKHKESFDFLDKILVEVYTSSSQDNTTTTTHNYEESLFIEINKSEPMNLVDMPGVASTKDRNIITTAASKLKDQYPDMFKPSQKCRPPHLNIDNLRDVLFASDVIQRHTLTSSALLLEWIQTQNEALKGKYDTKEGVLKNAAFNEKSLKKAKEHNFYLGLEAS